MLYRIPGIVVMLPEKITLLSSTPLATQYRIKTNVLKLDLAQLSALPLTRFYLLDCVLLSIFLTSYLATLEINLFWYHLQRHFERNVGP